MNWEIHRIASSDRYSDPMHVIETQWSITDVWDAHRVIDAYEEAARRAHTSGGKK